MILGLEFRAVPVSVADNYALRGDVLRKAMEADKAAGYVPFFVGQSPFCLTSLPSSYGYECSC